MAALAGCTAEPVAVPPDDGPVYLDAAPPPDGTALRDAAGLTPDAAILDENGEICRFGRLAASVCAPAGGPLIDAQITVATRDCDGRALTRTARTDARGGFRLTDLRAGPATVRIQSGRFTAQYPVDILPGTEVGLIRGMSGKVCLEPDAVGLAVLSGDYDRVDEVLDDLGFEYDAFCGASRAHRAGRQLIGDLDALATYEVLFANCGTGIDLTAANAEVATLRDNLRAFVAGGGSLYVSDLAAGFVSQVWPDRIDFAMALSEPEQQDDCCVCLDCGPGCEEPPRAVGSCGETTLPIGCSAGGGVRGRGTVQAVEARIIDDRLAALYGGRSLPIAFDLPGWVEIDAVAPGVDVLVEADFGDRTRPLVVGFTPEPGGGRVVYTSFHNEEQAPDAIRRLLSALVFEL